MTKRQTRAKKPQHFNYITFVNVIAALAVLLIHLNSWYAFSYGPRWAVANALHSILMCAVPLFFMISGATLIDYRKRYDTKTYFKKRFLKTLIPFLFWSIIAALVHRFWLRDHPMSDYQFPDLINRIFDTRFIPIFWFFIPLFALYLIIPILSAIDEQKRQKVFQYIIISSLILNFIIPYIISTMHIPINFPLSFTTNPCMATYYAVVGYYIHNYKIAKPIRISIYTVGIIALFVVCIGTHILSYQFGELRGFNTNSNELLYALYSPALFLFMKQFFSKHFTSPNGRLARFAIFFNRYTFSLYLLHWFPIVFFSVWTGNAHNQWWYIPVMGPLCIILSIILTKIFAKIPLLRHTLPS